MIITVEENVSRVLSLAHHDFRRKVLRALFHRRALPLAIQIEAGERSAIISNNHAIRIEHWNYFENEVVS